MNIIKIGLVTLLLFTLLSGCTSKPSESVQEVQTNTQTQTVPSKEEQTKEIINLTINVDNIISILGNVKIFITISNNTKESIYLNPYNFTLAHDSGDVVKITSTSINGITLEPNQKTSGYLEFVGFDDENTVLTYNNFEFKQQMNIQIPKSK